MTHPRILAVITARGGSKGLPRKNVLPLAGTPLIGWTIAAAKASVMVSRVVVSTDDEEIASVARALGADVPFLRPAQMAEDTARIEPALLHAVEMTGGQWDYVVLLQPTSPFRTGADIDAAIRLCMDNKAPAVVSFSEPAKSPYWMYVRQPNGHMVPLFPANSTAGRRQDLPATFAPNGMVYVSTLDSLRERQTFYVEGLAGYVMEGVRSVDVDSQRDLDFAEWLATRYHWVPGGEFVEEVNG